MLIALMDIDDVQSIGRRLFGRRWRAPLARVIGVAPETVSRWLHQKQSISYACEKAILQLATQSRYTHYRQKRAPSDVRRVTIGNSQLLFGKPDSIVLTQSIDVILCDIFGSKPLPDVDKANEPVYFLQQVLQHLYANLSSNGRMMIIVDANTDPRLFAVVPSKLVFNGCIVLGNNRFVYCFAMSSCTLNRQQSTPPVLSVADVSQLIADYTTSSDNICDPFMGEGQLAQIATQLGRCYMGIESDYRYWLSVRARLTQTLEAKV